MLAYVCAFISLNSALFRHTILNENLIDLKILRTVAR